MSDIVTTQIELYLRGLLPERTGLLQQIEADAKVNGVPIVHPEVAQLLFCLVKLQKPQRILEVGTATGYSALWLARGLEADGRLTTIELDANRAEQARSNFAKYFGQANSSLSAREQSFDSPEGEHSAARYEYDSPEGVVSAAWYGPITLLEGDAKKILPTLGGPYDLVFLDAAKGQYPEFLRQTERLLAPGGLLVADNILFRGMVAQSEQEVEKRYRTIVRRLKEFLHTLSTGPEWDTTVLPVGDGVVLSQRKKVYS